MKKTLSSIFLMLMTLCVYSQEGIHQGQLTNPIPENFFTASPDVAAFQKFNTLPVSLYTGKINVSIPIFEVKSGNISVPISITYNSGGVKVDDFASSVGLNWNLNAGGSINRIIKDLPDNEVSFQLFAESNWDTGITIEPWLGSYGYNRKAADPYQNSFTQGVTTSERSATYVDNPNFPTNTGSNPFPGNLSMLPGNTRAIKDLSPDIFNVNAPGLSSRFTAVNNTSNAIYPNNNNGFTTTFLDGNGAKLESLIVDRKNIASTGFYGSGQGDTHYSRTTHAIRDFFEFNLINSSGLKYKFADEEVSESYHMPLGAAPTGGVFSAISTWATMISNNYSKRVHTWNLSSIFDVRSNRTVTFDYETYSNDNTVRNTYVKSTQLVSGGPSSFNQNTSNACTFKHNPVTSYNYSGTHTNYEKHPKRKRLTKISYDQGEVLFIYGMDRLDYPGEKALTEIHVKDVNGVLIKKFRFNYSNFVSKENCTTSECRRLKLESVDFLTPDNEYNSYAFEYEYTNPLPKRGSLQQDYLGFYNNNGVTGVSDANTTITPKLYHYANQGRHTILPFQRSNASHQLINGQIDFTPNTYSLSGLLKKITYPTGGSSEFEYENNTFKFEGATYTAGGARVKSQTLKENGVVVKKLDYEYKETDGSTSGYINNIPVYGYMERFLKSPYTAYKAVVYDKPKGGLELTSGSFVGYSRVLEKEANNGYTEYKYAAPNTQPNTPEVRVATSGNPSHPDANSYACSQNFISNSAYPSATYIDNDYKRGTIIQKKIYDKSNTLLMDEVTTFTARTLSTLSLQKDFKIQAKFPSDASDAWDEGTLHILDISSSLPVAQNLQTQTVRTEYLEGRTTVTTNQTTYDANYPYPIETKLLDGQRTLTSKYYYPHSTGVSSDPYMSNLRAHNRNSESVKLETYEGGQKLMTQKTNYDDFGNGLILPKSLSTAKGISSLRTKGIIDLRDEKGNILELHSEDGIYTTLIYGHNHSKLLAKIENARYSTVIALLPISTSQLQSLDSPNDHATLISYFQTIRNSLTNAKVTSYTHIPLVGVNTITDDRGKTMKYVYDDFNRLSLIKDTEDNIIKRYEYHYKNQQ